MTRTSTAGPLAQADQGAIEAEIAEMIEAGQTDAQILKETRIPLATIREIRLAIAPATAPASPRAIGSGHVVQPRADRRYCKCGALQSEHRGGVGACERTWCRAFEAIDE